MNSYDSFSGFYPTDSEQIAYEQGKSDRARLNTECGNPHSYANKLASNRYPGADENACFEAYLVGFRS